MNMPNLNRANLRITAGLKAQFPGDAIPHVVFLGRSNVGKSSLINGLLGRKSLARVSSAPGKTITINFYDVDGAFFFVDLPGYGFAKRAPDEKAKWSSLTDGYVQSKIGTDRLYFQLIDCKAGPTKDDLVMMDYLEQTGADYFIIATKCDKPNKTDRNAMLKELEQFGVPVFPFSALTGEGRDQIWEALLARLE